MLYIFNRTIWKKREETIDEDMPEEVMRYYKRASKKKLRTLEQAQPQKMIKKKEAKSSHGISTVSTKFLKQGRGNFGEKEQRKKIRKPHDDTKGPYGRLIANQSAPYEALTQQIICKKI